MGFGYVILLVAVAIITYPLFERRMIQRAIDQARRSGRRINPRRLPNFKVENRAYIIAVLIIFLIVASSGLLTGGIIWILLGAIIAVACIGYILYTCYHAADCDLVSAMTYLIWTFGAFVFCILANIIKFPAGLIAGFIAAIVVAFLPRVAFLQGYYDRDQEEYYE